MMLPYTPFRRVTSLPFAATRLAQSWATALPGWPGEQGAQQQSTDRALITMALQPVWHASVPTEVMMLVIGHRCVMKD